MSNFKMEFKEPSEQLVLNCIDKVLENKPTLAKQYGVLATILRRTYKLNIKREEVVSICTKEDNRESVRPRSNKGRVISLKDYYEDSLADALAQNSESPFVEEYTGYEQDFDFEESVCETANKPIIDVCSDNDDLWNIMAYGPAAAERMRYSANAYAREIEGGRL